MRMMEDYAIRNSTTWCSLFPVCLKKIYAPIKLQKIEVELQSWATIHASALFFFRPFEERRWFLCVTHGHNCSVSNTTLT
jgi:hypothetical protein